MHDRSRRPHMTAQTDGAGTRTHGRRVAVVGPGRVGTALATALTTAGHTVTAVAGRGQAALERFHAAVPGATTVAVPKVGEHADLVLLTVGDDALDLVVRQVAGALEPAPDVCWVHTSGRVGTAVLRPLALTGGRVAACHPAQTFPSVAEGSVSLPGVAWAVTAGPRDRGWAHRLVSDVGGQPVDVAEDDRVRYHLALALASNAAGAVVALARDLLLSTAVTEPERFLTGLARQSVTNAARSGAAAITGPARRGDAGTVAAHVDDLATVLPEALPVYRALTGLILSYARRAGLSAEEAEAVLTAVGRTPPERGTVVSNPAPLRHDRDDRHG